MSGFSKNELIGIIKKAIRSNNDKVGCANITPTLVSTTTTGSTTAGVYRVSITNTGLSDGTVAGETLSAGDTLIFEGYFDPVTRILKRIESIDYDATGTTFIIIETP